MSDPIIITKGLSKWYGQVIGLNNFNLEISPGITGIVGPNGSGKSTLFKLITGMIKSNVGDVKVLGQKPWKNTPLMGDIGLCPDFDNLPDDSTGREFLELIGGVHAMAGEPLKERIGEVAKIVGMTDALDRKIAGYSRGMRQRMKIAGSIVHDPKLLLLDEPLAGTDPLARKDIIELIKKLNKEHGHDIIVSSHVLFEIERVTRNVILIYKGRAVATGHISDIRGLIDKHPHNIILEGGNLPALAKLLLDKEYTASIGYGEARASIRLQIKNPEKFFDEIPELILESEAKITKIESEDDNLEAVFKYLVGW